MSAGSPAWTGRQNSMLQAAFRRHDIDHFRESDHRLEEFVANKDEQIASGLMKLDQGRWDPDRPEEAPRPSLPERCRAC